MDHVPFADDDLVITGISGRFPSADNMEELKHNLFSKKNCIVEPKNRWSSNLSDSSAYYVGILKSLDKYDSEFFNETAAVATKDDPQLRILNEVCYEAIADSGYSTNELNGKHIGVFVGYSDSDPIAVERSDCGRVGTELVVVGYIACMVANKLSYRYGITGPSFAVDSACSSSGAALEEAFMRLRQGTIDAAIVGGSSLCLDPRHYKLHVKDGMINPIGESCPFDANANGYVLGETISVIFIQKKKDARRIYAKIHNVASTAVRYEVQGSLAPSSEGQLHLYKKAYESIDVDPSFVDYIEGHGLSMPLVDATEVNSIEKYFCSNRKVPLLLGSVKSSLGHAKAASALSSMAKVIIAFETGLIPPNINYATPNPKCQALVNGRIEVVTETTTFDKRLAAINSFGLGGALVHMILERNNVVTNSEDNQDFDKIPKLVLYAATTQEALTRMFDHFNQNSMTREFLNLLNKSAYLPLILAPYRGFTILKDDTKPITSVQHIAPVKRQLWYVVTGMGCQWPGMGLDLMRLKVFAESMKRSAEVLERVGIDLIELLSPDKNHLLQERRITPAFVTIVAIQIALVDILKALGLEPDGIIGHSTGEIVCAYADGCATAEETILSAYYRGASVESTDLPPGEMAAVGLTWEEAKKRCPEGVFPACNNAKDSVTISGSTEAVHKFVKQLQSENTFARIVNAYGYAFHCKTISAVTSTLRSSLEKVYQAPKARTKRWLSTSYCEHEWNNPEAQVADATYFCHNLQSEVHFKEVLHHIPADAITVEIGPHFLLQSILKRSIGSKASYIGMMKRNQDNVDFLLSSIGTLYNLGLDPVVENLYESVSYPVPRGTPMISPLIQWDHSKTFYYTKFATVSIGTKKIYARTSTVDRFLLDHRIEGRSLYPATGYVYLAWQALSQTLHKPQDDLPVFIENFKILRATILNSKDDKTFEVTMLNKSGNFEIVEGGSVVATGKISAPRHSMFNGTSNPKKNYKPVNTVPGQDMYNELKIHGYEYGPAFQGLLEVSTDGTHGLVKWNNEWISYLDSLLLFFGIIYDNNDFKLPTGALSVKIDPRVHRDFIAGMEETGLKGIPVQYDPITGTCSAPGVEIRRLKLDPAPHRSIESLIPILEEYSFIPFNESCAFSMEQKTKCESYIQVCCNLITQIISHMKVPGKFSSILQNVNSCKTIEEQQVHGAEEDHLVFNTIQNILERAVAGRSITAVETELRNISDILGRDMLFASFLRERQLRPLLDVVVENCSGRISIAEWCDNSPVILTAIEELTKYCGKSKTNFTLVHSLETKVDTEKMNERNILVEPLVASEAIPDKLTGTCHLSVTCCMIESIDRLSSRIRKVSSLIKEGGFVLVIHKHVLTPPESFLHILSKVECTTQPESVIAQLFAEENLVVFSKKSSPFGINAYLLRKTSPKTPPPQVHIINVLDGKYDNWIEDLKKAMAAAQEKDNTAVMYLVAQDTTSNGIIGMVNCLKQEPGGDKIRCIFTDETAPPFDANDNFYSAVLKADILMNVYLNGCWGSFRHIRLPETTPQEPKDCAYVECTKPGDLSSFKWLETPVEYILPDEGTDEIYHVYYSSLNFKDVMVATGKLASSTFKESGHRTDAFLLGLEFSGRDRNGRRVMVMCGGGSICNTFVGRPIDVFDIPEKWTLEEAATVPVVYITCYYALIMRARLEEGWKILIHSGTGGIGQAAIRIALSMGCEIFTTVGTPQKRDFILKTFPQVKPENIGSSRDTTFEEMVMKQTKGEGVDYVLNSLAEDKLQASVRCLARNGHFLEIGKYDLQLNSALGMEVFLKGISFHSIQMDTYFAERHEFTYVFDEINRLLQDGIRRGVVQPLNTTVYHVHDVEKAFRYMASGKHIGKVLLQVRQEEPQKCIVPPPLRVNAFKTLYLSSNKSYIIIGGLGGFGIELAKWLVHKGAGAVVLTSRYGARTSYHHLCLKRWQDSGARVIVSTLNVAKYEAARQLLQETSETYGPIGGIFNSAVVLKDAFIENQTASDFEEVCAPKALATKHLDELSRKMCPNLDMFVCFSSISCGKGNAGQTNYGYANSVMERICEQRKKDGLHGLAVQWGIVGDVGLVHRHMGDDAMIAGVMAQKIKSCLHCLERFLLQDAPVVSSFVTADSSTMKKRPDDVLAQLAKMLSVPDVDQLNPYRTFGEMGIDSMIGVEMKEYLESAFDTQFSFQQIQDMKVDDVKKLMAERERDKCSRNQQKELKNIKLNVSRVSIPKESIVPLNSSKTGAPFFFVSGNDFLKGRLQRLCERVSSPVFALQSTRETPLNSLKDMSLWYLEQIQIACPGVQAHIVGVSTGASLALEMALQSELQNIQNPEIKSLTILDGSLELMEISATTEKGNVKNVSKYEASDLCEFLSAFTDSDLSHLKSELEVLPTLDNRVNMVTSAVNPPDKAEFAEVAQFYLSKQSVIRFHVSSGKLRKDMTAIEASETVLPNDVSALKSFMAQVCDGQVSIHRVVGSHGFLHEDSSLNEIAKILNKL